MKIVSWNVNGIRACYSKGLMDFIHQYQPDILCLQETKAHRQQLPPDMQNLGYPFSVWAEAHRKGYSGVATFCKAAPLDYSVGLGIADYDLEGRVVKIRNERFLLYNIYFPNGGSGPERQQFKLRFLEDLLRDLAQVKSAIQDIVVVGDYNIAPYPIDVYDPVGLSEVSGFLPEEREWFQRFFNLGFVDTFRHFYPEEKDRYTWWSYQELARISNRGWRIDFICVTKNLVPKLHSSRILDHVMGSDHCPIMTEFQW
ncbi:MAG: exodeoxyribonuclease III [Pseudobdellovibrionaceae bacterium]|nr:exodeoxyribonuclease III [Pseudobdellovibrionaceae bacterium]